MLNINCTVDTKPQDHPLNDLQSFQIRFLEKNLNCLNPHLSIFILVDLGVQGSVLDEITAEEPGLKIS